MMPRPPKPGGAVFVPRSFTSNRKKFGNSSGRLTSHSIESPQHAAAEAQHAIANKIREHILDENIDLKAYCENAMLPTGLSYERFQRINRGETMITLTDIMFWAQDIPGLASFIGTVIAEIASIEQAATDDGAVTAGTTLRSHE